MSYVHLCWPEIGGELHLKINIVWQQPPNQWIEIRKKILQVQNLYVLLRARNQDETLGGRRSLTDLLS